MPQPKPLYVDLAGLILARQTCIASKNDEWKDRHETAILQLVRDHMPSGSGVDNGTEIDLDRSTGDKIVFTTSFHHMNEGMYAGWTEHTITIRPSLWAEFHVSISGRNRNEIKDYLAELFDHALHTVVDRSTAVVA